MRGFMQGALGALCAYGAAWWGTGEPAPPVSSDHESPRAQLDETMTDSARAPFEVQLPEPIVARAPVARALPVRGASPPTSLVAPVAPRVAEPSAPGARAADFDPLAGAAVLPSDFTGPGGLPTTPGSLRELAEFRRAAETPAELVERVEHFEPSPAQLAEFRRVAAQLFNARPAGAEVASPWEAGGARGGQGSLVRDAEQRASQSGQKR